MSRWTEPPAGRRDSGFSLLEVVVALGILMVVVTALLPQLIVGIRATAVSNRSTVLKTVAQGEIEALRNLPYRVSYDADPDVIDLLDRYYPNLAAPGAAPSCSSGGYTLPTTTAWTGYVAASGTRCDFEPATGPFFRTVTLQTHEVLGRVALVTDIQFLSAGNRTSPAAQTLAPRSTYDSRVPARDVPPSSQVSAAVTVLYKTGDEVRSHTAYTQIAQRLLSPTRLRSEVDVTTVEISSTREDGAVLNLRAGGVNLEGALSHASTATANVAAALGSVATGDPATSQSLYGAARTVSAPPASLLDVVSVGTPGGCGLFCWGTTSLAPSTSDVTTDAVRPRVGSAAKPAQALITSLDNGGLRFDNVADRTAYRPDWKLGGPLVRLAADATVGSTGVTDCVPGLGGAAYLSATGYLSSLPVGDTSPVPDVEACAVARSSTIAVLPTAQAQGGVVRVTLGNAYARCMVDNNLPTATSGISATVQVYAGESAGGDLYTTYPLATIGSTPLSEIRVGAEGVLSDYLASWSGVSAATRTTVRNQAKVDIPAVLTIVTQPVRGALVVSTPTAEPATPSAGASPTAEASPTAGASPTAEASPSGTATTPSGSTSGATATTSPTASPTTSPTTSPTVTPPPAPEPKLVLDRTSAVTLTIGSVSCSALDAR